MMANHGECFINHTGSILQYLCIDGKHYNKCIKEDNIITWEKGETWQMDEKTAKLFDPEDGWRRYFTFIDYLNQAEQL